MARRVVDDDMRRYYDQRAHEYDDWWLGTGLFAGRPRPGWSEEVEQLVSMIGGLPPARTLDVACGTGLLTHHLPGEVVALDQSESMVAVAAKRMPGARVLQGDAVPLPFAADEFERVFTSHFYGHLLSGKRERFAEEARRVSRQLVVVDSALREDVPAEEHQQRVLKDGTRHTSRTSSQRSSAAPQCCTPGAGSWRWRPSVANRGANRSDADLCAGFALTRGHVLRDRGR